MRLPNSILYATESGGLKMVKKINFIFMLKRMESLGTAVSRNEAKMVVGGNIAPMMLGEVDDEGGGGDPGGVYG